MSRDYDPALEPDVEFYRVADEDLTGEPGNLIRSEQLAQDAAAALDDARATYRVLYQSASGLGDEDTKPTNEPIAVSGLIAFPPGEAPAGGWPVVSWAHGTVGSTDKSAPSMDPYLEDVPPADADLGLLRKINKVPHALLNAFLRAGWAVAMTDYEGLGTYGNHPYLLGVSEGRGILDIVPAVHQLAAQTVGQQISDRYAIVGHSQGGQAALWGPTSRPPAPIRPPARSSASPPWRRRPTLGQGCNWPTSARARARTSSAISGPSTRCSATGSSVAIPPSIWS